LFVIAFITATNIKQDFLIVQEKNKKKAANSYFDAPG